MRQTRFSSIPAQGTPDWPRSSRGVPHRHRHRSSGGAVRSVAPVAGMSSNSNSTSAMLLPRPPRPAPLNTTCKDRDLSSATADMDKAAETPLSSRLASTVLACADEPAILEPVDEPAHVEPAPSIDSQVEPTPAEPAPSFEPTPVEPATSIDPQVEPTLLDSGACPATLGGPSSSVICPPSSGGPLPPVSRSPEPGGLLSPGGPSALASRPASSTTHPSSTSRSCPSGKPPIAGKGPPSPPGPLSDSTLLGRAAGDSGVAGDVGLADLADHHQNHLTLHSGASTLVSNKLGSFRRSLRLASKNMGINKNSLQRAQDLMSSKLKSMKASHYTQPAPAAMPSNSSSPLLEFPPAPLAASSSTLRASSPLRDPTLPLTAPEIRKILSSCGIIERVGPVVARINGDAPLPQEEA